MICSSISHFPKKKSNRNIKAVYETDTKMTSFNNKSRNVIVFIGVLWRGEEQRNSQHIDSVDKDETKRSSVLYGILIWIFFKALNIKNRGMEKKQTKLNEIKDTSFIQYSAGAEISQNLFIVVKTTTTIRTTTAEMANVSFQMTLRILWVRWNS